MEVIVQRHFGSEKGPPLRGDHRCEQGPHSWREAQPAYFAHVANTQSTGAAFSAGLPSPRRNGCASTGGGAPDILPSMGLGVCPALPKYGRATGHKPRQTKGGGGGQRLHEGVNLGSLGPARFKCRSLPVLGCRVALSQSLGHLSVHGDSSTSSQSCGKGTSIPPSLRTREGQTGRREHEEGVRPAQGAAPSGLLFIQYRPRARPCPRKRLSREKRMNKGHWGVRVGRAGAGLG